LLEAPYSEISIKRATSVNALDILISLIAGFCIVRGIFRGIVKEITSIVGVFVGFYTAYTYYPLVAKWLSKLITITNRSYLDIMSFFLCFTIIFLAIGFVGVILKQLCKAAVLGWADRILGGTFAAVKAVLIASVLLVALTTFLPRNSPVIRDSVLAPRISFVGEKLIAVIPKQMKEKFGDNIKSLKETWKKL
jgi:membrane protein required for colicin V production